MPVDPDDLRQYYSALSDEALLAIDRADLINMAQNFYDEEIARRRLHEPRHVTEAASPEEVGDVDYAVSDDGEKPGWLDEAVEAFSRVDLPGTAPGREVEQARDVLEAAGIPCYVDFYVEETEIGVSDPSHRWQVLVPGTQIVTLV